MTEGVRIRRPSALVTALLVVGLVASWLVLYSISLLGGLWRFNEPDAPPPILTTSNQLADLALGAVQIVIGFAAVAVVSLCRRRTSVLPPRQGTASDAAIGWCAAIAASSAVVLVLAQFGLLRFSFSAPALVQSDWLAVLSALLVGAREEPLLVALPVVLLAGRVPLRAIIVLSAVMRGGLYLFFGGGGFLWAFLWGAAAVWIYYRYRRLWVLIAIHGLVMNIQVLDRVIPFDNAATVLQWVNILVLFTALLWWVTPRVLDAFLTPPPEARPAVVRGAGRAGAVVLDDVVPEAGLSGSTGSQN